MDLREGNVALPAGAPNEWTARARFWAVSEIFSLFTGWRLI